MNYALEYRNKNYEPRKYEITDWYNESIKGLKNNKELSEQEKNKALFDLTVTRDDMLNKLEEKFDSTYGFQDYDIDYSSRPAGELTGPYTGQSTASGTNYGGEGQGFQRAFGGENETLNMFVYGGKYPHGGSFHSPLESSSLSTAESLMGNPFAQTADDPYVNPLTGESPALVYNSETGGYDETKSDDPNAIDQFGIEFKQKMENAYTFSPEVLRQQGLFLAGTATNLREGIKGAKKKVDQAGILQDDRNVKGTKDFGTNMANTPGESAINKRTIVQSYSSKLGGPTKQKVKIVGLPLFKIKGEVSMENGQLYVTTADGGKRKMTQKEAQEYYDKNKSDVIRGDIPEGAEKLDRKTSEGQDIYYTGDISGAEDRDWET